MAPNENCFNRLCDAVLESIFEKVLWNPFLRQHQARDRVRLEAVCKRFQEVVRITGCLEWDFYSQPQTERRFVRFALRDECRGSLKKLALRAERHFNLVAVLQSVTPHAVDSLQEVYLLLDYSEEDAKSVDWESVLAMLQECQQLIRLHIILWESSWHCPAVILDCLSRQKPFLKLQDLSLFGFAIADTEINSLLKYFPSLKTLELHHLDGQKYDLSSVRRAVLWGSQISGLGVKGMVVPKSLELLVGLLDCESSKLRLKVLWMLYNLMFDGKSETRVQVVVARVPGCLQKLVNLLNIQGELEQGELALGILEHLVMHRSNRRPIATCSGSLQQLLHLFGSACETIRGTAAYTIGRLAHDHRANRFGVQLIPSILQGLVDLLDDDSMEVQSNAVDSLARFADNCNSSELIVLTPGALDKVVRLLECGEAEVQEGAAWCLQTLAKYDTAKAVAQVPGSLEGLVSLLRSPSIATRGRAAWALRLLAEERELAQKIQLVPGFWQKLVECLDPEVDTDSFWTPHMQRNVVDLLRNVGAEAGVIEAIASTRGSLQVIVDILDSRILSMVKSALWMLSEMTRNQKFRIAIANLPGVLKKLEGILSFKDFKGDVHEEALMLLNVLR